VRVDVRGGRHASSLNGLYLFGVGEDVGELPGEELFLLARQLEIRESSDALNIFDRQSGGHPAMLSPRTVKEQKGDRPFPGGACSDSAEAKVSESRTCSSQRGGSLT